MMQAFADIQYQLENVVKDIAITAVEKAELRELIAGLTSEKLSFLRNRAFDIARNQITQDREQVMNVLRWLEQLIKLLDKVSKTADKDSEAYFSPGDSCRNKLCDLLHCATKNVDICVFTISDDKLRDAIVKAHRRGVTIRIITDNDKTDDMGSDIDYLVAQNINIVQDCSPFHMHHKFALFDNEYLVNGSFNWTRSASTNNEENIIVLADKQLINQFQQKFDELWKSYRGKF